MEKRAAERKAAERRELERKRALEQRRVYEAQQRAAAAKSSSNAGAQAAQSRGNLRTTVQNPAAKETNPKKDRKGGAHWLWLVVLIVLFFMCTVLSVRSVQKEKCLSIS